jgi:hypothetical protein
VSSGRFRVGLIHPIESYLRTTYRMEPGELDKVAYFILAHGLVDLSLISLVVADHIGRGGGIGRLTPDEVGDISDQSSSGTFSRHLEQAEETGRMSSEAAGIARALNRTRDEFLHWRRSRPDHPVYKGLDVTREKGFKACMDDALRFLQAPFQSNLS